VIEVGVSLRGYHDDGGIWRLPFVIAFAVILSEASDIACVGELAGVVDGGSSMGHYTGQRSAVGRRVLKVG